MRPALAALAAIAIGCAADPVLLPDSGPCSSACGAGTVCQGGACVAVDAGTLDGGAMDVGSVDSGQVADDRSAPPDDGSRDTGVDAGSAVDVQQPVDAGSDVPVDVGVCPNGRSAVCDGRTVMLTTGERDGGSGQTFFCGACSGAASVCAADEGCVACRCQR